MSDAGFGSRQAGVHPGVSLYCATSAMLRSRCLLAAVGKHAVAPWPRVAMSAEVADALHHGRPVVALESTIISHGMVSNRCAMPSLQPHADVGRVCVHVQPFPQNLETAKELEGIIRAGGATPATIAIVDGVVTVGMEGSQLEAFASLKPSSVLKASRRDIGLAIAKNMTAATTVAGTMCVVPRVVDSACTLSSLVRGGTCDGLCGWRACAGAWHSARASACLLPVVSEGCIAVQRQR